jgi:N-acetylglucosamine kinase-like BadF-type ATPase
LPPAPQKANYLLGIDIGNSKTHALLATLSGEAVGFAEAGCGSYEVLGAEGYTQAMQEITSLVLANAGASKADIAGMGFGIAGYDWPSEHALHAAGIEALGIAAPNAFVNDVEIGIYAGAEAGWGIAVDAGTGNNVRGRDAQGRTGRITGNSFHFGEFGGGSELIGRTVIAVSYAWTGRGPQTALTQAFLDFFGLDNVDDLMEGLAMQQLQPLPPLAEAIFQVASAGDAVARDVINWNARELAESTKAVIRQLSLEDSSFEVVLVGSLFKAGEIFLAPFREAITAFAPGAKLVRLSVPPVVGAVLLAAEKAGIPLKSIRRRLIQTTEEHLTS